MDNKLIIPIPGSWWINNKDSTKRVRVADTRWRITHDDYIVHAERTDGPPHYQELIEFFRCWTLETEEMKPLASEPEPLWWTEIAKLAKQIEQISGANFGDNELHEDAAVKIGTLANIIIEQCDKLATLNT